MTSELINVLDQVYAFLGLVGIYFFLVFFNIAGEFLVNLAGFVIPLLLFFPRLAQAQQTRGGSVPPAFFGSVAQGTATSGVIPLSIADVIDRHSEAGGRPDGNRGR